MGDKYNLITPENIQAELIRNEIELNNLKVQAFKEQKYNEMLREYKQLQHNWNELKKHCNTMLSIFEKMNDKNKQEQLDKYVIYDKFLSKMQELEGNNEDTIKQ